MAGHAANLGTPHSHGKGVLGALGALFHWHGHDDEAALTASDPALGTAEGIRTVWLALLALGATTVIQIVIVLLSGSVALFADTAHNLGDTLNSIPLLIAFYLARRVATRRYTYGYGKAEDVAGILIVLSIAVSAAIIFYESFQKLLNPQPMQNIPWVAAAAIVGFLGNEAVALLQIRTGRRIGSEAMVADGLHARTDGLTSLAVLVAAGGTLVGLPILDPIIGLLIGVAILFITKDAALRIWHRLMDAVDPIITDKIEQYAGDVKGVEQVQTVRARWVGHALWTEVGLIVNEAMPLPASQRLVREVQRSITANVPHVASVSVAVATCSDEAEVQTLSSPAATPARSILPPRYQQPNVKVSAAPMGAAALKYDQSGQAAWNEVWTGYCELALAGGPPHRGSLLEPPTPEAVAADPEGYERVLKELERGIRMVTGLKTQRSDAPGWIGMACQSEEMALWLLRAIVVENVSVRREGNVLFFPAGPSFRLEREIKNVVTVIAKTNHYWVEHAQALEQQ